MAKKIKLPKIDLAPDIYEHARSWWGLQGSTLTDTKCRILGQSIKRWRAAYRQGEYGKLRRMYQNDRELLGYLAAFGPRYAYTLYFLLHGCKKQQRICEPRGVLRICYFGGGPAIDLVGLLAYLYEKETAPRDMQVHFVDRSPEWRRFHNTLFGTILPKYFPRTRALPHYHDLDLCGPSPDYSPSLSSAFDSTIFVLSNTISEFSDKERESLKSHLRFILRAARGSYYFVVADSNAPKLRPRVSWIDGFTKDLGFKHFVQFDDSYEVECDWLVKDPVSKTIYKAGKTTFMTGVKRRGYVAKVLAGRKGERLPLRRRLKRPKIKVPKL